MRYLVLFVILVSGNVFAEIALTKSSDKNLVVISKDQKHLTILGKARDAKTFCTEDSLLNPENIEVYKITHPRYAVVLLCPAELDGEPNAVSIFGQNAEPVSTKVLPASSSSRITDEALREAVSKLLKK